MQLGGGGEGALNFPLAGPGQRSGGVQVAKPLGAPEIWHFKVTQLCGSVSLYKMNLKEKIIHFMFQTRLITRFYKYSQVKSKILKLTLHLYIINIHQPLLKLYGCRSP